MTTNRNAFWDDLARDLQDPEFLREYVTQSVRIATIDDLINRLDIARGAAGISKTALARAISVEPATIRRLFSAVHTNPTLGTLAEVAAALGFKITMEPLDSEERTVITEPLLSGTTSRPTELIEKAEGRKTLVSA